MIVIALRLFVAVIGFAFSECAQAHGLAGNRFFLGTMAFTIPPSLTNSWWNR
jgi:hypothetical protein